MQDTSRVSRGSIAAERIATHHVTFGNRLLDSLSRDDVARLSPHLRRAFLHRGQELLKPGQPLDALYFPIDALLWSWTTTTGAERPTTLFATGRRGAMSMCGVMELGLAQSNVVVLSPGSAWKLQRSVLDSLAGSVHSPLRRLLLRFGYAAFAATAYRLACNSEHNVDRRLARWLLFIMDETGKPEASLTHQQIADVAAIRRPSVSLAFSDLQRRGIIRVHHGLVQILDRDRLERETCPCYGAIQSLLEQGAVDESLAR